MLKNQSTTSPPLVGIHPNPGPRAVGKGKRKAKKQDSDSPSDDRQLKKLKREPSQQLTENRRLEIKRKVLSGQSAESIIREGKFSKKGGTASGHGLALTKS